MSAATYQTEFAFTNEEQLILSGIELDLGFNFSEFVNSQFPYGTNLNDVNGKDYVSQMVNASTLTLDESFDDSFDFSLESKINQLTRSPSPQTETSIDPMLTMLPMADELQYFDPNYTYSTSGNFQYNQTVQAQVDNFDMNFADGAGDIDFFTAPDYSNLLRSVEYSADANNNLPRALLPEEIDALFNSTLEETSIVKTIPAESHNPSELPAYVSEYSTSGIDGALIASAPGAIVTTAFTTKKPTQTYSPPKHKRGISKTRPRRGSNNEKREKEVLDYSTVKINNLITQTNSLRNVARIVPERSIEELVSHKLVELNKEEEERITTINRTRYIRGNIDSFKSLYDHVRYDKNPYFGLDRPYEPEFISYEIDMANGLPHNETRCGLCPYCPDVKFRNFKTSTYSQHLALWHGIHTDNYLTPNPSHYGVYRLAKDKNKERKTIAHLANKNGVVCPVCHDVIETECSKATKSKPLSGYLRHFRDNHRKSNHKYDISQYFTLSQD